MTHERQIPLAAILSAALLLPSASETRAADPISLALPLACEIGKTCFVQNYADSDASSKWKDYRCGEQTYDGHGGTDFRVPSMDEQRAGVDVIAAAPGTVIGTRDALADISVREGSAESVKGRECGNGVLLRHEGGWVTQYCHIAKDSIRVSRGQKVETGTPLGRIGLSGNTEFPHLHFSVRHNETKIDPFAYQAETGSCGGGKSLWNETARTALSYRRGEVMNAGFAGNTVTMAQIDSGETKHMPPTVNSPVLIAYVRAIGLEANDVLEMSIVGPDGKPFVQPARQPPLDHSKAQYFTMVGKKRGQESWQAGTYTATYRILRDNSSVLEKTFMFDLPRS
jgi:murein DD-endopeptidase MepM/ murein hydrolase activator NlpD